MVDLKTPGNAFIQSCRAVVNVLGEFGDCDKRTKRLCLTEKVSCYFPHSVENNDIVVFEDDMIRILAQRSTGRLSVTRLENDNPVVVIGEDGNFIRYHGEAIFLFDHVWSLLEKFNSIMINWTDDDY